MEVTKVGMITQAANGQATCAWLFDSHIKPTDKLLFITRPLIEGGGMNYNDFDRMSLTNDEYIMGSKSKPKSIDIKAGLEQVKEWVDSQGYNVVAVFGATTFEKVMGYKGVAKFYGKVLYSDILNCKIVPLPHPAQLLYKDPALEQAFTAGIAVIAAESGSKTLEEKESLVSYKVIDKISNFRRFIAHYKSDKVKAFAYDIEATGFRFNVDKILTIQFSHKERLSYLIPTDFYEGLWTVEEWQEIVSELKELFADDSKTLIGHNIKYDNRFLQHHWGIPVRKNNVFDTMIAKFLCDETTASGLKDLACTLTDMGDYDAGLEAFKKQYCKAHKMKVGDFSYAHIPLDILAPYGLADTDATMRLYNIFSQRLIEEEQLETFSMVMRFQYLLSIMEITGSPVDVEYAKKYLVEVDDQLVSMSEELKNYSFVIEAEKEINNQSIKKLIREGKSTKSYKNVPFNFNSVNQKRILFFDIIGLPIHYVTGVKNRVDEFTVAKKDNLVRKLAKEVGKDFGPTFVKGERKLIPGDVVAKYLRFKGSVDKRTIKLWETTAKDEKVVEFLRFSELSKIRNTYINSIIEKSVDGWIHPSFNVIGAKTGRLSCRDPNYQNIPAHSKEAKKVKRITKAPEGWVLVGSDLSAAEMRWVTIASGDAKLTELFNSGYDSHGVIAKEIFNLDCHPNEVKDKYPAERQISKMCQFLSVYGGQCDALSAGAGITVERAQEILDTYFETYSGVADYLTKTKEFVEAKGYSQSLLGRRNRHMNVPALASRKGGDLTQDENMVLEKELRVAINATIQSVSSDGMLLSACNLQDEIDKWGYPIKIVNIIHDALYCLVREDFVQEGKDIIIKHLTTLPPNLFSPTGGVIVPGIAMEASAEWGYSWDDFSEDFGVALPEDDEDEEETE
jgi:DNA polymerase I-like protein with 3'-5' exonuclease and polymerase domains